MHKIYYKGKEYLASIPDIIDIQINNSSIVDSESQIASIPTLIGTDGTSNGVTGLVPQPTTADRNKFLKSDGTWAIPAGGGGGGTVDSTDIPTAGKVSEFDNSAHINSEDMSSQDVDVFLTGINAQGIPSEYKKLLWTNPNPSSAFTGQTILSDVDLSEYDEFEIEVRNYITGDIYNICRFENTSQRQIWVFDTSNFTGSTIPVQLSRIINISSSGMAISNGYSKAYNSTSAPSNSSSICLPTKIYGIKYEKVAPIQVNASDYVIEQDVKTASDGTVWNCRKWDSGVAECWCKVFHTITGWTAWYSWYYSRPDTTKFSFPTNFFIDVPIVEASRSSGIAGVLCEEGAPSATQTQQYYLIRPDGPSASGFNLDIHAIGKWK